jgi:hypothetical protein
MNSPKTRLLDAGKNPLIMIASWAMEPSTFAFMIITRDIAILVVASRFPNPRQLGVTVSPTDFCATISLDQRIEREVDLDQHWDLLRICIHIIIFSTRRQLRNHLKRCKIHEIRIRNLNFVKM